MAAVVIRHVDPKVTSKEIIQLVASTSRQLAILAEVLLNQFAFALRVHPILFPEEVTGLGHRVLGTVRSLDQTKIGAAVLGRGVGERHAGPRYEPFFATDAGVRRRARSGRLRHTSVTAEESVNLLGCGSPGGDRVEDRSAFRATGNNAG